MKNKKLIGLSIFVLTILSFNVLAVGVSTPSDFFSSIYDFFKGIVTGTASMDDAYFISFFLYFILLLAIFIEGLRVIPLFGRSGELNKNGKVFGIAAASLATIALFVIDTRSGISTADRLVGLVSPFGVWGGVAISGIVAYITYRFIHDTETFREQTMKAIAVAAAVGVTFAGFFLSMENLIGWGFLITIIALIVGLISRTTGVWSEGSEDRRSRREQEVEGEVERHRVAGEERTARREAERRRDRIRVPEANLVQAIELCDDLDGALRSRRRDHNRITQISNDLHNRLGTVSTSLRRLRRGESGEVYSLFDNLFASSGVSLRLSEEVQHLLEQDNWEDQIDEIRNHITGDHGIRTTCGLIVDRLHQFIEEGSGVPLIPEVPDEDRVRERAERIEEE